MQFIEALATAFINTFGITQPTEQTRKRASWFILGMLTLIVVVLCIAVAVVFHMM